MILKQGKDYGRLFRLCTSIVHDYYWDAKGLYKSEREQLFDEFLDVTTEEERLLEKYHPGITRKSDGVEQNNCIANISTE